jgi:hypothetical protein
MGSKRHVSLYVKNVGLMASENKMRRITYLDVRWSYRMIDTFADEELQYLPS